MSLGQNSSVAFLTVKTTVLGLGDKAHRGKKQFSPKRTSCFDIHFDPLAMLLFSPFQFVLWKEVTVCGLGDFSPLCLFT